MGATALVAAAPTAAAAGRCGERPWCKKSLSPEQRTKLLLAEMTLVEKLSLMGGDEPTGVLSGNPATGTSNGVPRVGIPTVYFSDGPVGPREGRATAMPGPLALASTFDPRLAFATGAAVADEVKHKGNDIVHAPTVDVVRTPLAGRTFETYGEDPLLSARMAVEWIRGAQDEGIVANVKHYAPNSQEGVLGLPPIGSVIGSRFTVDAVVDERTLREIYLPPFEAAVKRGHVGSVMCAYNRVNGTPACQSRFLLEQVLRREWGFRGFVLSDYIAGTKSTVASARNGLDLDLPFGVLYTPALLSAAVAAGQVGQATIDDRVGAILRTMFRFGLFDRAGFSEDDSAIDRRAHASVARRVERQGIVLLKNTDHVLPIDPSEVKSVAVIGEAAKAYVRGGGSSNVAPFDFSNPLDGIRRFAGNSVAVSYEPGDSAAAAARAARKADLAIVFAADHATEGTDKPCLRLNCVAPDPVGGAPTGSLGRRDPDALIEAVAGANPRTVVVLQTGGPVLTPWADRVSAVVEAWYPGQQAGPAIAAVLFGEVDPGGRLPVTFPVRARDIPTAGNRRQYPGVAERAEYSEGVFIGYRHYDEHGIRPAWPFGHGLSYTRFRYGKLRIDRSATGLGADVRVRVRNVGDRRGYAVPQLYLGIPPRPGIAQPPAALKDFRKISLRPGRSEVVSLALGRRSFAHWDETRSAWRVSPGCYRVMVGSSSGRVEARGTLGIRRDCD